MKKPKIVQCGLCGTKVEESRLWRCENCNRGVCSNCITRDDRCKECSPEGKMP